MERAARKHLVLVGMRAAGKTCMGKAAAAALQKKFVDLDHLLEAEVFGCTIGAYLDRHSWAEFRAAEAQLLSDVLCEGKYLGDAPAGCVIATGGGIVETASARELLAEHSPVVWVDRHIDDIIRTLEGAGSYRPGLGTPPREIYAKRRPLYDACSDHVMRIRPGDENWPELERRFAELCKFAEHVGACGSPPDAPASPVIVPVTAAEAAAAEAEVAEAAAEGAGLVELRLDRLGRVEEAEAALPRLLAAARRFGLVALATVRPTWEDPNASYAGEEEPRLALLQKAASLGASFIDVEHKAMPRFLAAGGLPDGCRARLVVSSHDFGRLHSLAELRALEARMRASAGPAGVVKIAQMPRDAAEAARMLALLEECRGRATVALAMGPAGAFTRLLSPRCGGLFTFGALEGPGRASAPGQPTARAMWDAYRLSRASGGTKVVGVLADDAQQGPTVAALNAAFGADGYDAVCVPLPVDEASLAEFLVALPRGLLDCVGAAALARRREGDGYKPYDLAKAAPTLAGGDSALVSQAVAHYQLLKGSDVQPAAVQAMRKAASAAGA